MFQANLQINYLQESYNLFEFEEKIIKYVNS